MKVSELTGKNILILGFGQEGRATYEFLHKCLPGELFSVADKNKHIEVSAEVQNSHLGDTYLDHLEEYDVIIKTPGISPFVSQIQTALQKGIRFTSATEIFFSEVKGRVIGITGTKGKSTTSALLYDILRTAQKDAHLIGNIGSPALSFLKNDTSETIYIFELSSYQLQNLRVSPQIGIFTSFFPAHLTYHKDLKEYFDSKMNLFVHMKKTGKAFWNSNFSEITDAFISLSCQKYPYNDGKQTTVVHGDLVYKGRTIVLEKEFPLIGKHNAENALGAIAVAKEFDISDEVISEAVSEFTPLEHRLEPVGEYKGIRFYNDSQSSTPSSTIAAIQAFGNKIETIILGGLDNKVGFEKLGEVIADSSLQNLVLFPDTGKKIWQEVKKSCEAKGKNIPQHIFVHNMKEAVWKCYEITSAGKICILSPACQSFNMFSRLEERGKQFKEFVKELGK